LVLNLRASVDRLSSDVDGCRRDDRKVVRVFVISEFPDRFEPNWSTAMSELKARITEEMKRCMKSGERSRLDTIRLILAALKQREVDERIVLSDAQVLEAMTKMLKQRRDSIEQFTAANRMDLADKEAAEVLVIQDYMPAAMSDAEIDAVIAEAISETAASSAKDMGKVIAAVKAKVAGKADMQVVSARVKAKLA
jgi:hypothetical protein